MIAALTGTVLTIQLLHIIVEVGGIGYKVAVQKPTTFKLGASVALHTHLAVRENALDLYGFLSRDDLAMFELLITVPKIGPKSAMQILSQADTTLLTTSIVRNDPAHLTKMSGISKKTAEKIVSALQSKFEGMSEETSGIGVQKEDTDIVDALIALGYTQKDARDALMLVPAELEGTTARIKAALKVLGGQH